MELDEQERQRRRRWFFGNFGHDPSEERQLDDILERDAYIVDEAIFIEQVRLKGYCPASSLAIDYRTPAYHAYSNQGWIGSIEYCKDADRTNSVFYNDEAVTHMREQQQAMLERAAEHRRMTEEENERLLEQQRQLAREITREHYRRQKLEEKRNKERRARWDREQPEWREIERKRQKHDNIIRAITTKLDEMLKQVPSAAHRRSEWLQRLIEHWRETGEIPQFHINLHDGTKSRLVR